MVAALAGIALQDQSGTEAISMVDVFVKLEVRFVALNACDSSAYRRKKVIDVDETVSFGDGIAFRGLASGGNHSAGGEQASLFEAGAKRVAAFFQADMPVKRRLRGARALPFRSLPIVAKCGKAADWTKCL